MGTFQVRLEIGDPQGQRYVSQMALVDTGATYTTAPASLLRDLGVAAMTQDEFELADGRVVGQDIGFTWVRAEGRAGIVPVVFGDEGTRPLVGAVTLEVLRLGVDPVRQRLTPVRGLLMGSATRDPFRAGDRSRVRQTILGMALRRRQRGSGTGAAALKERTAVMQYPDLSRALTGIPWAIVGGVATRLYMPERATLDLDVAVHIQDAQEARKRLAEAGYRHVGELSIGGSSWVSPSEQEVDVLELTTPWATEALAQAQSNRDPQGQPVLPLPYFVLMKLQAGRVQDLADVARMLGQASDDALAAVRQAFRRYAPDDIADLESLITLGKLETQ